MPSTFHTVESGLAAAWPVEAWRDVNVLLAVSGGADSVALLRAVAAAKAASGGAGTLAVAHFDHQLRPESAADSAWLAEICRKLEIHLEIGTANVFAAADEQGDGVEAAARQLRYEFFRQTAEKLAARFVATAHTRDDQVETVLLRIVRGTGVAGLRGMPCARPLAKSVSLVRPLLQVTRGQVLHYLQRIGQDFRTDSSNADERFTRNRLRLRLLPLLRAEFNPEIDAAILRLAQQADDTQQVIESMAGALVATSFAVSRGRIEFESRDLGSHNPHLIREACKQAWDAAGLSLQAMGFYEWQQLACLVLNATDGSLNLPGNVRATKSAGHICIAQSS